MNLKEIVGSIKSNVFVLLLALLIACSSYASALPELPWTVSIAVPTLYPAKVTEAYGVNEEQDWTSLLHNFSQFMRISDFKNISPRFPEYEGFGLPIADYAMNQKRQISPIKLPPDTLYLYWVSLLNTQFYVTKYEVPMRVRDLMAKPARYRRMDGSLGSKCYRTEFVFGLLTNGQAKIYLRGCGEIVFLKELAPDRILDHDSNGFTADTYKSSSYIGRIHKRAVAQGVSLDPIPWDKVNEVYANEPIISLGEVLAR